MPQFYAIDWLGVLVGAIAAFVFGAVWYSALGKAWMRAAGIAPEAANMTPTLFAATFVILLVMATGFGALLAAAVPNGGLLPSLATAVVVWVGVTAAPMAINHRYQGKGWDLSLIDGLHWLGVLLIMAAAIALI
ncbi:MAG: DUF1761 domain-containing protein [Pseudomonadota bacterium]